jgi:hypothetical protein
MAEPALIIDRDGEQYAVPAKAYRESYAAAGFKPLRYEDGTEYAGATPAAVTKADLVAEAERRGIALPPRATKAQIEVALAHGAAPEPVADVVDTTPAEG